MGLFGNNNTQQNGALSLGVSGQTNTQSNFANPFASQQQQAGFMHNPAAQGFMGGMGMNQQQMGMMGQPMAPPSEAEIQLALMKTLAPMDRFIAGNQMAMLLETLSTLVSYSVLEILKNAVFVMNEDEGTMKMDITSLPSNLQTMSAENVTGNFTALQSASQSNIQQAEMQQQQIAALAQQSMMGGALNDAMQDEGFMNKAGGAAGNFMGKMMGMR